MLERGKYRIQSVAEMTGVNPATLRAWERRYGIPSPQRTSSSYRLFSDHDVRAIRALKKLCDEGMAPAEAARTLKQMELDEEPSVADSFERAISEILSAVDAFDPVAIERAARQAMFLGSASTVYNKVFAPVMRAVGDKWHMGTVSIAQEHVCTDIMTGICRDLLRILEPVESAPRAVLACFAEEDHVFPLYGVAYAMHRWGYRPIVFGSRTPPVAVGQAVDTLAPAVVGLSVTVTPPAAHARELCEAYARACGAVPWVVGGPAAVTLREIVEENGGLVVESATFEEARAALEGAIRRRPGSRAP